KVQSHSIQTQSRWECSLAAGWWRPVSALPAVSRDGPFDVNGGQSRGGQSRGGAGGGKDTAARRVGWGATQWAASKRKCRLTEGGEDVNTARRRARQISAIALMTIGAAAIVSHGSVKAQDQEEFLAFGVFGITGGQTARLHAVPVGVAGSHLVELIFFD